MVKKTSKIGWSGASVAILVAAFAAAIAALFFIIVSQIEKNQNMMYSRTSINYYVSLYDEIQVSESGDWFLFPELGLRFPFSTAVAYNNEFGRRPQYHFSTLRQIPETNETAWQLKLSYLENTSTYEDIHYAPLTLVLEPELEYNVGDVFTTASIFDAETGKETDSMDQIVSDIVTLEDGEKLYVLTYDNEKYINDEGEHIYQDLIEAVEKIEQY